MNSVIEKDKAALEKSFEEKVHVRDQMNKKKNYAKLIMETHKPKISKKKQLEMELIVQNLKNPNALAQMKRNRARERAVS